jgi:hypothetical protein
VCEGECVRVCEGVCVYVSMVSQRLIYLYLCVCGMFADVCQVTCCL